MESCRKCSARLSYFSTNTSPKIEHVHFTMLIYLKTSIFDYHRGVVKKEYLMKILV